jgi:hypothetical protein
MRSDPVGARTIAMSPVLLGGVALGAWLLAAPAVAWPGGRPAHPAAADVRAQAEPGHPSDPRALEPRYEPVPPAPEPGYDTAYFFAITRAIAGSTLVPAAKLPLFVLSVPVDVALLPFAAIGGFF